MATNMNSMQELLPKNGLLFLENVPSFVLCKPKLLPLKSMTLERLEKMQQEAQDTLKEQEAKEREEAADGFGQQGIPQAQNASTSWQLNRDKEARFESTGSESHGSSQRPNPRDLQHEPLDSNVGDSDYKTFG